MKRCCADCGRAHSKRTVPPIPDSMGADPEAGNLEQQGFGWQNNYGSGNAGDTITSGFEGAWTATPTDWSNGYLVNLYNYDWEQTQSPAGNTQWIPTDGVAANLVPDAFDANTRHASIMFTTDLAEDGPGLRRNHRALVAEPLRVRRCVCPCLVQADAQGPGPNNPLSWEMAPDQTFTWQDPVLAVDHDLQDRDVAELKQEILDSGLIPASCTNSMVIGFQLPGN